MRYELNGGRETPTDARQHSLAATQTETVNGVEKKCPWRSQSSGIKGCTVSERRHWIASEILEFPQEPGQI